MTSLIPLADRLSDPKNYFSGSRREWYCPVDNIILFLRRTRTDLQRRTFESKPHHRFVLLLNLECPGVVNVDRHFLKLPPQHALLIHPYQFHYYPNLSRENILWLFITFETDTPQALEEFQFQVMPLSTDAMERAERILSLYQKRPSFLRANLLATELSGLLAVLRSKLSKQQVIVSLEKQNGAGLHSLKLIKSINRHLAQPERSHHKIGAISRKVGISESRLRFLFRKHFGVSLGAYIQHYQTHQSIALMQNFSYSLKQVALASGYTSLATFSRAFKTQTGLSPRAFRQSHFNA